MKEKVLIVILSDNDATAAKLRALSKEPNARRLHGATVLRTNAVDDFNRLARHALALSLTKEEKR